ncbi:MAG: LysM peptidoglycan-binding domain-containing protein [Lachnospiraceae bacterium]|nr:LysM peptidoglycan-binding domain-containing protein [Lachnospiraceae bacterium]
MKRKYVTAFLMTLILIVAPVSDPFVTRVSAAENHISAAADVVDLNESDWDTVSERIDTALKSAEYRNVNVFTGYAVEVPDAILKELAGKKATLALHTGDGLAISITGTQIRATDKTFKLIMSSEKKIPESVTQKVTENAVVVREFNMVEKEPFPFRVNVHVGLGTENAGKPAILYSYDEGTDTLQMTGIYPINESGSAMFGLNKGDEYLIVVRQGSAYVVKPGEYLGGIARRNGISVRTLMEANPHIVNADFIYPGQVVIIP